MKLISNRTHEELMKDLPIILAQAQKSTEIEDSKRKYEARRRTEINIKKIAKAKSKPSYFEKLWNNYLNRKQK